MRAVLCTAVAAFGMGCGECVFEDLVTGIVRDGAGQPLASATVTTCSGWSCDDAPADTPCRSTTTDADGRFSLTVQQCRPAAFQCALRPLRFEHPACAAVVVQPVLGGAEQTFSLACP